MAGDLLGGGCVGGVIAVPGGGGETPRKEFVEGEVGRNPSGGESPGEPPIAAARGRRPRRLRGSEPALRSWPGCLHRRIGYQ